MVQAADGRLFMLTNHSKNILVYHVSGRLLESWTLNLSGAHGLTLHQEGDGRSFCLSPMQVRGASSRLPCQVRF